MRKAAPVTSAVRPLSGISLPAVDIQSVAAVDKGSELQVSLLGLWLRIQSYSAQVLNPAKMLRRWRM